MVFRHRGVDSLPRFPAARMNPHPAFRLLLVLLAGWLGACSKSPDTSSAGPSQQAAPATLADLTPATGPRLARLVWLEENAITPSSVAAPGVAPRRVFAYDASDGLGIRAITPDPADYARPLFSGDGNTILYTRLHATPEGEKTVYAPEIILHPWDGLPRSLGPGMAVDVGHDSESGKDFIYAMETLLPGNPLRLTGEKLLRFLPEKPDEREIIWTSTPIGTEQFQLSRDSRRATGCFPFPKAGVANLTTQTFTPLAAGAWPAGAPDNSYATAVLDGSRRRLRFFAPNLDPGWELTFMGAPGWQDGGLLHPRWSNDPGLLVFTGPHKADEIAGDLSIVRFSDDFRSIQLTARLTTGRLALSPDMWVENTPPAVSSLPQTPVVIPRPEPKPWPAYPDELAFAWDNFQRKAPLANAPGSLTAQRFATPGRYSGMDLTNGWFEADPAAADAIAKACTASSAWSMEMILTERPATLPLSVRIVALMLPDGREAFALYRVDRKLVLRLLLGGTPERPALVYPVILTNLAIESDRPVHLLLSLRNNRLSCWLDGQMQKDFSLENSGLAEWGPGRLSFGDPLPYGNQWSGNLERIAIWSRALADDEIRESSKIALQWTEPRKIPGRITIKATPAAQPTPEANGPDQLLSVGVWEIQSILSGQLESKRVAIAMWSRLQGRAVPPIVLPPGSPPGTPMDLVLESWDDHPELESIPRISARGADDYPLFFLPRYFAPSPP